MFPQSHILDGCDRSELTPGSQFKASALYCGCLLCSAAVLQMGYQLPKTFLKFRAINQNTKVKTELASSREYHVGVTKTAIAVCTVYLAI